MRIPEEERSMRSLSPDANVENAATRERARGRRGASRRGSLRIAAAVATLGLALVSAACGGGSEPESSASVPASGSWNDVVAAAEKEGKVTIYSGQGTDQLNALAAKFQEKYPKIKVEVVRGVETALAPKVEAEARTGKGISDLFVTTDRNWIEANKGNFVAPRGPAFDDPAYKKAENVLANNAFVVTAAVLTYAWNTERFKGKLADYSSLIDPALAGGKIDIPPIKGATFVDFYSYLEETYGADYLKKLSAQKPRLYPSALPMAEALSSGEISAATFVQPQVDEKEAGAPVEWGVANPSWGARFQGTLLKSAPHPNAAQVLADFMITKEGQEAIARKAGSVLPDTPGAVAYTEDVRKPSTKTPAEIKDYEQKLAELFGQS
jgi:iron(III) transport system substrate-binding protein